MRMALCANETGPKEASVSVRGDKKNKRKMENCQFGPA